MQARPAGRAAFPYQPPCPACTQVQTKLKLVGIEAIYLASSGERITRLDQLQDIDELAVVEVRGRSAPSACVAGPGWLQRPQPAAFSGG